jgi:hypothetical protein
MKVSQPTPATTDNTPNTLGAKVELINKVACQERIESKKCQRHPKRPGRSPAEHWNSGILARDCKISSCGYCPFRQKRGGARTPIIENY